MLTSPIYHAGLGAEWGAAIGCVLRKAPVRRALGLVLVARNLGFNFSMV